MHGRLADQYFNDLQKNYFGILIFLAFYCRKETFTCVF